MIQYREEKSVERDKHDKRNDGEKKLRKLGTTEELWQGKGKRESGGKREEESWRF